MDIYNVIKVSVLTRYTLHDMADVLFLQSIEQIIKHFVLLLIEKQI